MPIPVIAAVAIGVGGLILGGGGTGIYISTKDKKRMAQLQDQIRMLQLELQLSHDREKELLASIENLERQKLAFIKEIEFLTVQRESYVDRIAELERYVARNEKVFKKVIAALTFKLDRLKEENLAFKDQIDKLTKQAETDSQKSESLKIAVLDIDAEKVRNMNNLTSLRSNMAEQEREIQDLESQVI
jgi:chromosome segregation ATPase